MPDEWVGLIVPGQFQTRFYTVRHWVEGEVTLDVVVHDAGLVTEWADRRLHRRRGGAHRPARQFAPAAGHAVGAPGHRPHRAPGNRPDLEWASRQPDAAPGAGVGRVARGRARVPAGGDRRDLAVPARAGREQAGRGRGGDDVAQSSPGTSGWPASRRRCARSASTSSREVGLPSASYNVTGYWRRVVAASRVPTDPTPSAAPRRWVVTRPVRRLRPGTGADRGRPPATGGHVVRAAGQSAVPRAAGGVGPARHRPGSSTPRRSRTRADRPARPGRWFGREAPLVVEVGSGTGEALVALAAARPDHDVLALEVWRPGVARTLQRLERTGVATCACSCSTPSGA